MIYGIDCVIDQRAPVNKVTSGSFKESYYPYLLCMVSDVK